MKNYLWCGPDACLPSHFLEITLQALFPLEHGPRREGSSIGLFVVFIVAIVIVIVFALVVARVVIEVTIVVVIK